MSANSSHGSDGSRGPSGGSDGRKPKADGFDVVWPHSKTSDGEGTQVLRMRPGRLEAGEMRPLKEGRPITGGGQVVKLAPREDSEQLYDVEVQYESAGASGEPRAALPGGASGPPQVASPSYRESWERTFGGASRRSELN